MISLLLFIDFFEKSVDLTFKLLNFWFNNPGNESLVFKRDSEIAFSCPPASLGLPKIRCEIVIYRFQIFDILLGNRRHRVQFFHFEALPEVVEDAAENEGEA